MDIAHDKVPGRLIEDRLVLARHFHSLANVPRVEIFGTTDYRCMPLNLPDDATTMFAGYVGANFAPRVGLLLLAINPGGGGDAYTHRIPEDELFYPLISDFKQATPARALLAFERVNEAFGSIVKGWNLWKILEPTLAAAGKTLDQVAYMNIIPYRTRGDKMPPANARRRAWEKIIVPTLEILSPRAIVTLGKKAGSIVDRLHTGNLHAYCVPRTIGDSYVSFEAQKIHERMQTELRSR